MKHIKLCVSERAIHCHLKGDYVHCGEHCVCVFHKGTRIYINRTNIHSVQCKALPIQAPLWKQCTLKFQQKDHQATKLIIVHNLKNESRVKHSWGKAV